VGKNLLARSKAVRMLNLKSEKSKVGFFWQAFLLIFSTPPVPTSPCGLYFHPVKSHIPP